VANFPPSLIRFVIYRKEMGEKRVKSTRRRDSSRWHQWRRFIIFKFRHL